MKLVGHKCVGSAVTQAARYKPYDPQNFQVNPKKFGNPAGIIFERYFNTSFDNRKVRE